MAINQKANVEVTLNNEQAKRELEELQASMKKLAELRDKAFKEGNVTAFKAYDAELKKATRTVTSFKKELFDVNGVMKNLSGASMNDLRKASTVLTNEVSKLDRTTAQYAKRSVDLKRVKAEMAAINNETKQTQSLFSRVADGFNKYLGLGASVIAGIAGISLTIKGAIQGFNDYEERVANLSSLTGLAGEELKWLSDQARELGTATLEGGVLVTNGSQEIVDAFTKVGSARPELLKNKEALVEVTKNAMILSAASKEELQPSIEALTMVMNQYNTSADQARRIINTIAAGSKAGAGEIPYITQAFEKAGTVAADAGLSIETMVATIETLAPRISQPEIAGRSLKGVLLDLQAGADDTNPAIVGMSTALENLGKKNLSITELTKMFGAENITTAKILINNVGELKKYEAAVTGTNVALEQGAINTDTNNARLAQAKERIRQVSDELGGKLAPIYASIISKSSMFLKSIVSIVDFLIKYGRTIITVTSAILGYTLAVKVAANWTKIQTAYIVTASVVEKAYALVKGVLTGKIKLATLAQRAWNLALKSNPIGLIVGLIAGAVMWLIQFDKKTGKVSQALKVVGGKMRELANWFIELYNSSLPIRIAVQYLIALWKTGFEGIKLVVRHLWEELKLGGKLLKAVFTFDFKGIKEALADFGKNSKDSFKKSAENVADAWSDAYNNAMKGKLKPIEINKTEKTTVVTDQENITDGTTDVTGTPGIGKLNPDGSLSSEDEDTGDSISGSKKLKSGGTSDVQSKKLKELETAHKLELAAIEKQYFEKKKADEQFKSDILKSDQKFQDNKKTIESDVTIRITTLEETHKTETASIEKQYKEKLISESQYNTEILKIDKKYSEEKKSIEDKSKTSIDELAVSHKKEISEIEKLYSEKSMTEEEYKTAQLKSELKFIEEKKAVYTQGTAEYAELETQSYQKQAQIQKNELENKLKAISEDNDKQVSSITKRYDDQEITEEQYQAELLAQEMKFMADKMAIYEVGSAEYNDIETKYSEKQIEVRKKMQALLLDADKDLNQAKLDALKDGIDKEKAIENARWKEELAELKKRLITKQVLSKEEVALNDKINKLIEQKQSEHNDKIKALDKADDLKKKMDAALVLEAQAKTDQEKFEAKRAQSKANYDQEVEDAQGDHVKLAQAEKKYTDDVVAINKEAEEKKRADREKTIQTSQELLSQASNLVNALMESELKKAGDNEEKKKEIQKKYANIQFAITAAQIISDTASAVMKGFAQLGPIAGAISAAIMVATGAVQLAIANRERKNVQGFSQGGYTAKGDKNEPAGIVHKGEWVAPKELVESPETGPIIKRLEEKRKKPAAIVDIVETSRRKDRLAFLDLPAIVNATTTSRRSFAVGGYTSPGTQLQTAPIILQGQQNMEDTELKELIRAGTEATKRLMKWQPKVATEMIKKDLQILDDIDKNSKL